MKTPCFLVDISSLIFTNQLLFFGVCIALFSVVVINVFIPHNMSEATGRMCPIYVIRE